MTERLTSMQLRILAAMRKGALTAFLGDGARKYGFGVYEAKSGGIVIRAYQMPQYFLAQRKLIRQIERDGVVGTWYTITSQGCDAYDDKMYQMRVRRI